MTMAPLRVGVVGVGHLGQHHARILGQMPGVELVAIADTRAEQARAVAERVGTRAVDDYLSLIGQVDAVSIAAPTFLHRRIAGAFLERGVPTMVEKPLAASLEDAEELVALARQTGAVLQVGHIERFNPALTALEAIALRPKFIAAERLSTYTFRSTDVGVVLDLMIHDLDLILSLVSAPVRSVAAVGVSVFGGHEDIANARIEFENGCVANITASRASMQATRKMRLYGAEGYASLDFATKQATLVRPSDALRRGEVAIEGLDLTRPAEVKERVFGTMLHVDQVQTEGREPLALELEDFVLAVRGQRPRVSGDDALRAMRLADQILRSLETHSWEGEPTGPAGPHNLPVPLADSGHPLRGPISWRIAGNRQNTPATPERAGQ